MNKDECEGIILQQDLDGNLVPWTQLNELSAHMTEEMIQNYHDNPAHGYPGISKTVDLIQQAGISVTNLQKHVTNYVKKMPTVPEKQARTTRTVWRRTTKPDTERTIGRHINGLHHQTTQVQGPSHRNHL